MIYVGIISGLCRYSKKVADEYPWTQAVPDDPHSVSPNTPQIMPKVPPKKPPKTSYQRPPEMIFKVRELWIGSNMIKF